jgi:hypothetical protein
VLPDVWDAKKGFATATGSVKTVSSVPPVDGGAVVDAPSFIARSDRRLAPSRAPHLHLQRGMLNPS